MKRLFSLAVIFLFATLAAHAQDWAKTKLEKSPRHSEWVKVTHGSRVVQCFVVYPEVKDKATAIVLIHEIFGLSDWAREMADELAAEGYIVVAPDLLSGMGPKGGGIDDFADQSAVTKAVSMLPAEQVTADLNAAFVFYGMPPDAGDMAKINCPVYGFYAGNDARITATVPTATAQMKSAGKTYEPVIYDGAGHGFMRAGEAPDANDANKKAREDGFQRLLGLLKKV